MLDNIYILTDIELCNRIATKIKTVRLKQNMSQAELADKSGVSISTINPNRSLDTPGLFSVRKMRLSGILPASVRILFRGQSPQSLMTDLG